jgi:hypothetical protein
MEVQFFLLDGSTVFSGLSCIFFFWVELKTIVKESLPVLSLYFIMNLSDTGLLGELENLKIKSRLIDEKFMSVIREFVILKIVVYY